MLQRAILVDVIAALPISLAFFFFAERPLIAVFGSEIGAGAAEFLRWSPPYFLVLLVGGAIRRALLSQRAASLVVIANGTAAIVSPLANVMFTHLGIFGGVTALTAVAFCNAVSYVLLAVYHPSSILTNASWPSPDLFNGPKLIEFLRIGIPSMVAVCAEWWAFDVLQVFTIFVDKTAVAAFSVGMSLLVMLFSAALGVSVAASVLVGNALGANQPDKAQRYTKFILSLGAALAVLCTGFLWMFGRQVVELYTDDEDVIAEVMQMLPIVLLCHFGDSAQFAIQGIYRGAGMPSQAALAVLLTLWLVGLPAAGIFSIVLHLGVKGVFIGLLSGFAVEIPLLLFLMSRWDWEMLAANASTKTQQEQEQEDRDRTCDEKKNWPNGDDVELAVTAVVDVDERSDDEAPEEGTKLV